MRAVREIASSSALAVLSVVLAAGCAHPSRTLYPGSVSGSKRAVPDWVDSPAGIPCPKGETCVIGVSRCAPDGPQALDASRMSGYARLASMAFPVDVAGVWKDYQTIELSGGSERSRTVISDDVRAELGGRVSGARVLDDYWSLRRVHSMNGVSDCYDGWSLMAIPTVDLESLYPRELERSAWEVARVGRELKPVEQAVKAVDSVFFDNLFVALSVLGSAEVALAGLQPVDGLSEIRGRLASAEAALGARIAISLRDVVFNGDGSALASVAFGVAEEPLPGLELSIRGCGLEDSLAVTDADGTIMVPVRNGSLFAACPLGIRFSRVKGFSASLQIPPAFAGSTVNVTAGAEGYMSGRLENFAGSRARAEAGRLARPPASAVRPMLDLTLSVLISTRPPVPYNGRVNLVTGTIELELTGWSGGRQAISLTFGRRDLRALGMDQSQMATAIETQIGQAVSDAVGSFADSIGVAPVR